MHSASIIQHLLRPSLPKGARVPDLHEFMFEHREDRKDRKKGNLLQSLRSMSKAEK